MKFHSIFLYVSYLLGWRLERADPQLYLGRYEAPAAPAAMGFISNVLLFT